MRYLIFGGTGTLGRALLKIILESEKDSEIVCFSRDEFKQKTLKTDFPTKRLITILGDIRDRASVCMAMDGCDVAFHVAALKHIDSVENNPIEGVKTNVLGTVNIAEAAIFSGVQHVIFSSTDKAVEPINVYGMTKAISEKYLFGLNRQQDETKFSVFRWGNVLGSRGSVLQSFVKSIKESRSIDITHPDMSRFWINIDDAAKFMLKNYKTAPKESACIPDMKASGIIDLADATSKAMGIDGYKINVIGIRNGEKLVECINSDGHERITSATVAKYSQNELVAMVKPLLEMAQ